MYQAQVFDRNGQLVFCDTIADFDYGEGMPYLELNYKDGTTYLFPHATLSEVRLIPLEAGE